MGKFVTLLFALIFTLSAFAEIGPINRSTGIQYDGTAASDQLEKRYINVINNAGFEIASGAAVVLDTSADDGASVTISASAGLSPLCIMDVACADNKLCLCQTYGYTSKALFDQSGVSATAGKRFYLSSANAGYVAARITENASEAPGGIFYDASAASGAVEVFIDL